MNPSQRTFTSVLWLDDQRMPLLLGVDWVRDYDQFVWHLQNKPDFPELISFDHDLAHEHYPVFENKPGVEIPYGTYKEKTGLEAAKYIVENNLPLKFWAVHSFNVQGRMNIESVLRAYRPQGELRDLKMPYRLANLMAACGCAVCFDRRAEKTPMFQPFIVCPTCGNKRCPKASFHEHACTGSNDSGHPGSYYGDWKGPLV